MAIRYETARVEANRNAQKISAAVVIAAPVVPHEPARPRRKLVALATVVMALIAVSAVCWRSKGLMTASERRAMSRACLECRCWQPLHGTRRWHDQIPPQDMTTRRQCRPGAHGLSCRRDWRPVRGRTVWHRMNW